MCSLILDVVRRGLSVVVTEELLPASVLISGIRPNVKIELHNGRTHVCPSTTQPSRISLNSRLRPPVRNAMCQK